jgi:RNA polymerase sigma factor (sigma-70 family)
LVQPAFSVDRIDRALAGDAEAIRWLVDYLTPVIQRRVAHVLARTPSKLRDLRQETADLTQDVFVALFEDEGCVLRRWRAEGSSLRSFVGLVAERRALDAVRKKSGLRAVGQEPLVDEPRAQTAGPERRAADREQLERLLARLEREVSATGALMFRLLFVEERSVEEIMAQTGSSAESIYAWRCRLRRRVRALWREIDRPSAHESGVHEAAKDEHEGRISSIGE